MLKDCEYSSRENQHIYASWLMRSLDVSRCAGDIGKPSVNTTTNVSAVSVNITYLKMSLRAVLATYDSLWIQSKQKQVLMSSTVGCVTDLGNKGCDDLRARFWSEHFGGCFIRKCHYVLWCKSDGATSPELEPFALVWSLAKRSWDMCARSVSHGWRGQPREAQRRSMQSLTLYVSSREFVCVPHMCV